MKNLVTQLIITFTILGLMNAYLNAQVGNNDEQKVKINQTGHLNKTLAELPAESFEGTTFPPDDWQKLTNEGGAGWQQGMVGTRVPGFPEGSLIDAPPGGGNSVAMSTWLTGDADSVNYTGQPTDQWLITPKITNVQNGDSLKFYLRYFKQFGDNLDVLISTTGDSIAAFDSTIATIAFSGTGNNDWKLYKYSLAEFVVPGSDIYIAFREHVINNAINGDALFLDLVEVASLVTNVAEIPQTPNQFELFQNYPNPFNPSTKIAFTLPKSAKVTLKIYNLLGQKIATLIDHDQYSQGYHKKQFDAAHLPNGLYYYRIEAGDFVDVRKMTLLK